jgi:hypothetical protein
MAEATKPTVSTKSAVSTKDVSALNNPSASTTPAKPPAVAHPDEPFDVKVVDPPAEDDGPSPYSTREGWLTDEEQVARYGYVLSPEKPFVSEGMRHDIATYGYANDPVSGRRVEKA